MTQGCCPEDGEKRGDQQPLISAVFVELKVHLLHPEATPPGHRLPHSSVQRQHKLPPTETTLHARAMISVGFPLWRSGSLVRIP